jgi:hypothetical protein
MHYDIIPAYDYHSLFLGLGEHGGDVVLFVEVFLLGDLLLLVLFQGLYGISFEVLRSERFLQLLLPGPVLLGLDQQLAGVLADSHHCRIVHRIGVLYRDYVVQLVNLTLDLPPSALLCPQLLTHQLSIVRNRLQPFSLQLA